MSAATIRNPRETHDDDLPDRSSCCRNGRAAILNLNARHNRLYSAGDLGGWIATFRHSGATFVRAGETVTDLRDAFDGGNGQRLVPSTTRSRSTASTPPNAAWRCCSSGAELRATGTYRDRAHLRARRLVLHVTRTQWDLVPSKDALRRYSGVTAGDQLRVRIRHLRGRAAHGRRAQRAAIRRHRGERSAHPAFRVDGARRQSVVLGRRIRQAGSGVDSSRRRPC